MTEFCIVLGGVLAVLCIGALAMVLGDGDRAKARAAEVEPAEPGMVRVRVVAHHPGSVNPTGYYVIEWLDGKKWVEVREWLTGVNKWNPVLLRYKDAVARATTWKDRAVLSAWMEEQDRLCLDYHAARRERRKRLYPVRVEEV